MDIVIHPRQLRGDLSIIPSKSQAHRLLICAAFADQPTQLHCSGTNRDMEATVDCLRSLGAQIRKTESGFTVFPVTDPPRSAVLNCCESGSTLRFLLPVVGALGIEAEFLMEGRLPERPLSPLWEEMDRMGCRLTRPAGNRIRCSGKLVPGDYFIDGGVSSQYITGLLLGLSLLDSESSLTVTGTIESKPYITMTRKVLSLFGADPDRPGSKPLHSPGVIQVEGDWSNGAFFLTANQLNSSISIHGLDPDSPQGDQAVRNLLPKLLEGCPTISAANIPDLVPILSVAAAFHHGAVFTDIRRLRLKESDRVASTIAMIEGLGGHARASEDALTIGAAALTGGKVDSFNDHRIAMAAAIAATACQNPVILHGSEAVNKSYPRFWEEYTRLGGHYEQHIR